MAIRHKLSHDEKTRKLIQTTQLIKRLNNHAFDEQKVKISTSQMKAIEILLRKSLPDLSNITHSGDANNPVMIGGIGWMADQK